jgi:hypothetical protein
MSLINKSQKYYRDLYDKNSIFNEWYQLPETMFEIKAIPNPNNNQATMYYKLIDEDPEEPGIRLYTFDLEGGNKSKKGKAQTKRNKKQTKRNKGKRQSKRNKK